MNIYETHNKDEYIAYWEDSKWLVLSSFSFIVPSFYAYYNNSYLFSILLFFTSLVSANYWRKATYSWRRNADLMVSKISFITFAYNGITYVRYIPYIITGYPLIVISLYFYYLSGKKIKIKNSKWYIYHCLFHYIIMYEQLIVLQSIVIN